MTPAARSALLQDRPSRLVSFGIIHLSAQQLANKAIVVVTCLPLE
jgi:hypothetical protein